LLSFYLKEKLDLKGELSLYGDIGSLAGIKITARSGDRYQVKETRWWACQLTNLITTGMAYYDYRTKITKCKMVVFGDYIEIYESGQGFVYNAPPPPKHHDRLNVERRADNLARTRNKIKRIVYANTTLNDKFITLTFDDKKNNGRQNTLKEGNRKFTLFIQRLRNSIGDFKYIGIPELVINTIII